MTIVITVKIPKISPGAYIFQRPFGGPYIRREICVAKSIGLAYTWKANKKKIVLPHRLCFVLLYICGQFPSIGPGGLYSRERFDGGFFALRVWGANIWRGLYMEGLIFGILRYSK